MSHQVQIHRLEDIVVGLTSALEPPLAKDLMVIMEDIDGGEGYHIYVVTPEVYAYP